VHGCDNDPLRDFHEYHSYWSPLGSVIVSRVYYAVVVMTLRYFVLLRVLRLVRDDKI